MNKSVLWIFIISTMIIFSAWGCSSDVEMIKKFMSNALLSVIMDKKARQKLDTAQKTTSNPNPRSERSGTRDHQQAITVPQARPDPVEIMDTDEINTLIRDSLDAAEQEIAEKKTKHAANPDRQALIDNALAIHKSKRHIVDELPEEQRQKLHVMATKAFGVRLKDGE